MADGSSAFGGDSSDSGMIPGEGDSSSMMDGSSSMGASGEMCIRDSYITFIHDGKVILTAKKDDLLYRYAVIRCKESQFAALDPCDIVAYRKRDYQIDVLISEEKEIQRKYKGIIVDHTTIDEIMLLLVKGKRK